MSSWRATRILSIVGLPVAVVSAVLGYFWLKKRHKKRRVEGAAPPDVADTTKDSDPRTADGTERPTCTLMDADSAILALEVAVKSVSRQNSAEVDSRGGGGGGDQQGRKVLVLEDITTTHTSKVESRDEDSSSEDSLGEEIGREHDKTRKENGRDYCVVEIRVGFTSSSSHPGVVSTDVAPSPADSGVHMLGSPVTSGVSTTSHTTTTDSLPGAPHSDGLTDTADSSSIAEDAASTQSADENTVYECYIPQNYCGLFIGRGGATIKRLQNNTNTRMWVNRDAYCKERQVITIRGKLEDIERALTHIRELFPLKTFPEFTLEQINLPMPTAFQIPPTLQLPLPEGVDVDVFVSAILSAGHIFVQQPTHPSFPRLIELDQLMTDLYSQEGDLIPSLPQPVYVGMLCAAELNDRWFRACVSHKLDEAGDRCTIKWLDYGGFSTVDVSTLKQIRTDFISLPFQANECYLAHVKPREDGEDFPMEANTVLEELVSGQIVAGRVVTRTAAGVPYVELHTQPTDGRPRTFINRDLVDRGVAKWYE